MSLDKKFKCPSCRREHNIDYRRLEPAGCSRCECELEPLVRVRISVSALIYQAWQQLRQQDNAAASLLAERCWGLMECKEIAECGMISCVLLKDLSGIAKWKARLDASFSSRR